MTDLHDPNQQQTPIQKAPTDQVSTEQASPDQPPVDQDPNLKAALPPYRQSTATQRPASQVPRWVWPMLLGVLIAGVLVGRYWGNDQGSETAATAASTSGSVISDSDVGATDSATEQAVLSVETVSPNRASISDTLSADGTISAKDTANVSAKVTGVAIERILVEEGQRVKAGQVLALFDTDAVEQQIVQAQADVAQAQATYVNAQADLERVLPLLDIDAISRQEADRYRTAALQAEATLQSAKARLNNQNITLNNAKVVAPVGGIISAKMIEVGQVTGGEPLFTIIKDGALEWQADIDPQRLGDITVGTPVRVSLPNNQSVMGRVSRVAPTAANNRQITIYATLAANSNARAGMYQSGEFVLGSQSSQTVPTSAIVSSDGYDYVMLVNNITTQGDSTVGRINKQRVSLGERIADKVVVTEPLPAEAQLVKQGGSFLNEGDLVRIVGDTVTTTNTNAE